MVDVAPQSLAMFRDIASVSGSDLIGILCAIFEDNMTMLYELLETIDHSKGEMDHYFNYFYEIDGMLGLCVKDTCWNRHLANSFRLERYIQFGSNTDPVHRVQSVAQLLILLESEKNKWVTTSGLVDLKFTKGGVIKILL